MIENVGRMAGMPVGPLSLNDEVAVDLAWKIVKATEADLGASAIDPRQKALLEDMVEKRGRLGRKNGKGFYDYPEKGPKKLWPGLAEMQTKKLDPDKIDVQEIKDRLAGHAGAGDGALLRGGRAHRRARGRRRLDPRLRLRAVLRRHAVLHRHDGRRSNSSSCASAWRRNTARALRRRSCCSTWRRRARVFMGASRPERRRRDEKRDPVRSGVRRGAVRGGAGAIVGAGLCRDHRRARSRRRRPADRPAPRSGEAPDVHRRENAA